MVPMVLIVPLLGAPGQGVGALLDIGIAIGKAVLVVVATLVVARFVVPRMLAWVDREPQPRGVSAGDPRAVHRHRVGDVAGRACRSRSARSCGGLVVAETEYSHRALGDVLPLRDAFVSVFFVSLGMLFDVRLVLSQPC